MSTPLSTEEIEHLAKRRAGAKLGWYVHALAFTVVNLVVFSVSRYGFGTRPWSVFPLLGWGLGLALHGVSVFVLGTGSSVREGMVAKERAKLQREQDRHHP